MKRQVSIKDIKRTGFNPEEWIEKNRARKAYADLRQQGVDQVEAKKRATDLARATLKGE